MIPHQSLDPATADPLALLAQFGMHPRTAIGFPAVSMYLPNAVDQ